MASTLDFFLNLHLAALRGVERREGGSGGRRRRIVDEIMQENMICFWLLHATLFQKYCSWPGSRLFVRNCMTSGSHFLFQLFLR